MKTACNGIQKQVNNSNEQLHIAYGIVLALINDYQSSKQMLKTLKPTQKISVSKLTTNANSKFNNELQDLK